MSYCYDDPTDDWTGDGDARRHQVASILYENNNARECEQPRGCNGSGVADADRAVNQKASAWISRSGP